MGTRYCYRLICRTCSQDNDEMGCWCGGWSELSDESYATIDDAEDAADSEIDGAPYDHEVVAVDDVD